MQRCPNKRALYNTGEIQNLEDPRHDNAEDSSLAFSAAPTSASFRSTLESPCSLRADPTLATCGGRSRRGGATLFLTADNGAPNRKEKRSPQGRRGRDERLRDCYCRAKARQRPLQPTHTTTASVSPRSSRAWRPDFSPSPTGEHDSLRYV